MTTTSKCAQHLPGFSADRLHTLKLCIVSRWRCRIIHCVFLMVPIQQGGAIGRSRIKRRLHHTGVVPTQTILVLYRVLQSSRAFLYKKADRLFQRSHTRQRSKHTSGYSRWPSKRGAYIIWCGTGRVVQYSSCSDSRHTARPPRVCTTCLAPGCRCCVPSCSVGVPLDAGDLLILKNNRTLHGRSPYSPRYDDSDRWVQRFTSYQTAQVEAAAAWLVEQHQAVVQESVASKL